MDIDRAIRVERVRQLIEWKHGNPDYFSAGLATVTEGKNETELIGLLKDVLSRKNTENRPKIGENVP